MPDYLKKMPARDYEIAMLIKHDWEELAAKIVAQVPDVKDRLSITQSILKLVEHSVEQAR